MRSKRNINTFKLIFQVFNVRTAKLYANKCFKKPKALQNFAKRIEKGKREAKQIRYIFLKISKHPVQKL